MQRLLVTVTTICTKNKVVQRHTAGSFRCLIFLLRSISSHASQQDSQQAKPTKAKPTDHTKKGARSQERNQSAQRYKTRPESPILSQRKWKQSSIWSNSGFDHPRMAAEHPCRSPSPCHVVTGLSRGAAVAHFDDVWKMSSRGTRYGIDRRSNCLDSRVAMVIVAGQSKATIASLA